MEGWGQIVPFTGDKDQALVCTQQLVERIKPVMIFPDGMMVGVYWTEGAVSWRIPPSRPEEIPPNWEVVSVFRHKKLY